MPDPPATASPGSTHEEAQRNETQIENEPLEKKRSRRIFWRKFQEGEESDWWFASTGIPLLAATLGPLANVSSLVALVTPWRMDVYIDGNYVPELEGNPFHDPRWCYYVNVASLICGFLGNIFLLFNFTQRIRYIIALPATIILWCFATGFLIAITAAMEIYAPPNRPFQTYTQGFWYAIAAASFYFLCSMLLMINMLGYFLGHYPDNFALSDSQRTLILQTMVFFIWLAGGAAVFMKIEEDSGTDWGFADSLYFCDVTVLTVGFGDFYPTTNLGRGIAFPFSVGGIVTLALIVSSIYKFMRELGEENIVMKHTNRMRQRTAERTVTNSFDFRQREHDEHHRIRKRPLAERDRLKISAPTEPRPMRTAMGNTVRRATTFAPLSNALRPNKKHQPLLLKEEKDRFQAMRAIQRRSKKYRQWLALLFSTFAFGMLWCIGAIVFWQAEKNTQGMTYFKALYFCYISLLTIGYGDLAPKSNAGRCFFVIWSLIAVPTMTILVSDLGDTVVEKFRRWSDGFADFTVLPKAGIWRTFLDKHPWLLLTARKIQKSKADRQAKKRIEMGFQLDDPARPVESVDWEAGGEAQTKDVDAAEAQQSRDDEDGIKRKLTLPCLADDAGMEARRKRPSHNAIAHHLALSIRCVAADMHLPKPKRYAFEEWVEFVRLIRLTGRRSGFRGDSDEEDEEGLLEWDWIGSDSPLMSGLSESEWLLERLCESLIRLSKKSYGPSVPEAERDGTREDGWVEDDAGTSESWNNGPA
ncbi:voltage-gated potassium channel [Bimuria novae-zelandiae CBS 107.79]|uniref:Voltage-gated potassium channel n=1 Tax=Bimuria novae-zelandiae CBS 107.79 TaxID=1447943 RepID=A0A6A5VNP6_9PLEO|nr:voltage-gated potassium channel [Bimuria novae-zelandiae CBS 107.79]